MCAATSARSPEPQGSATGGFRRKCWSSFICLMSRIDLPAETIARLASHSPTRTTEVIYRRELRPVVTTGAEVMAVGVTSALRSRRLSSWHLACQVASPAVTMSL